MGYSRGMSFWARYRIFQKCVVLLFCVYMGVMIAVGVVAFTRRSGKTGMDMGQVQKMRYEASQES